MIHVVSTVGNVWGRTAPKSSKHYCVRRDILKKLDAIFPKETCRQHTVTVHMSSNANTFTLHMAPTRNVLYRNINQQKINEIGINNHNDIMLAKVHTKGSYSVKKNVAPAPPETPVLESSLYFSNFMCVTI